MAEASAPASSANLGPGFDVLALALEKRCLVRGERAADWSVHHDGEEPLPDDAEDMVLAAAMQAVGVERPLRLTVENEIPIARGLGSSAAACAAAVAASWRTLEGEPDPRRVFELVASCEGHPDNAAAAVYGGLVLCAPDGSVRRLPIHPGLHPVVAVPASTLSTDVARKVVAPTQPTEVVVRSLARISALVAAFLTADPVLFATAAGDELHEFPRKRLRPEVDRLIQVARAAGALHACWSGAGPSVLALVTEQYRPHVVKALTDAVPDGRVLEPGIAFTGLR